MAIEPTGSVYLLGAGFSKAISAAMPVMGELAAEVLDELDRDREVLRPFNDDLESWLSYLSSPQPWLSESQNLRNRAEYFDVSRAILTMIDRDEQLVLRESAPVWLQRLVWNMSEESADVLTLNYDLLLERAAMSLRRTSGFSDLYVAPLTQRMKPGSGIMISRSEAPGARISLHKLHGSTNWYGGPPGSDSVPVCVVRDNGVWGPDETQFVPPDRYADLQPMITPPVAVKTPFYNSQALRAGWIRAAQALQSTKHLTVIGYSLPITDNSMAALVTMSLHQAAGVTIVDRSAATVKRISDLLPGHKVVSYVGPTAVSDYVGETCPQHVEWGIDILEDGSQVPNVVVDGSPVPQRKLPDLTGLDGPENWNTEQRFARWVGTQWPDVTSQRLPSERWVHPGGIGFAYVASGI